MRLLNDNELSFVSGGGVFEDAGAGLGGYIGANAGTQSGAAVGAEIGGSICAPLGPEAAAGCAVLGYFLGRDYGTVAGVAAGSALGGMIGAEIDSFIDAYGTQALDTLGGFWDDIQSGTGSVINSVGDWIHTLGYSYNSSGGYQVASSIGG